MVVLIITLPTFAVFASSMDPVQARQNVGPDLDPNCLTLCDIPERFCLKRRF